MRFHKKLMKTALHLIVSVRHWEGFNNKDIPIQRTLYPSMQASNWRMTAFLTDIFQNTFASVKCVQAVIHRPS